MLQLLVVVLLVALIYPLTLDLPVKRVKHPKSENPADFMNRFFPSALVSPHHPDFFNLEVPLEVPADTKYVVYWAADGAARNATVMPVNLAYNRYDNSGVASIDNGVAILRLASPQPYMLPCGTILAPHLHYRLIDTHGQLSSTSNLFLPSDKEHITQRQMFHSSQFAYLPKVN